MNIYKIQIDLLHNKSCQTVELPCLIFQTELEVISLDHTIIFVTCKKDQTLLAQQSQMIAPYKYPPLSLHARKHVLYQVYKGQFFIASIDKKTQTCHLRNQTEKVRLYYSQDHKFECIILLIIKLLDDSHVYQVLL